MGTCTDNAVFYCRECGGEFVPSMKQRGRQIFCSCKCKERHWRQHNKPHISQYAKAYRKRQSALTPKLCAICGTFLPDRHRKTCPGACTRKWARHRYAAYRRRTHEEFTVWKEAIGCINCGYNECGAALDFHHVDGKDFRITAQDFHCRKNSKRVQAELTRCVLLCKNCHAEEHTRLRRKRRGDLK